MDAIRYLPIALAATLSLGGCNGADAPGDNQAGQTPASGDAIQTKSAPAPALWNGGAAKSLDIQVAHPNGTVLQLTSLKTAAGSTTVSVQVINGRDRDIELNRFNNRQGYILLDSGERLYLSPPSANQRLSIPAGQTFEGDLVFLGRLPPVRAATLVLNENAQTDSEHTSTPAFRIDLPVGEGAAQ